MGREYRINEGDGAFYGPKIDFHIRDAINRSWQCGTIQLDMALPEKFDLEYTAPDGTRKRPVMIHRAIFGSIERFLGILIEHYVGKFPLWLSPLQIRILTVADRHEPYAQQLAQIFRNSGFHVEVDSTQESVSKKVRNAQLAQANYIFTVGDQEVEHQTANLRTRDNVVHGEIQIQDFLNKTRGRKKATCVNFSLRISSYNLRIFSCKSLPLAALKEEQRKPLQHFISELLCQNTTRKKFCLLTSMPKLTSQPA